jgi:NTP pyrophosphatase (non-canonical NTP hydrolase)
MDQLNQETGWKRVLFRVDDFGTLEEGCGTEEEAVRREQWIVSGDAYVYDNAEGPVMMGEHHDQVVTTLDGILDVLLQNYDAAYFLEPTKGPSPLHPALLKLLIRRMDSGRVNVSESMSPNQYQKLALRTENTPDFFNEKMFPLPDVRKGRERLLHGLMGVCTEAGELQDPLKRELFYGKGLDEINVMEECGDLLWYIALSLDAAGFTMSDAMNKNISKLRRRYPQKFTAEAALDRDHKAERGALEGE